MIKITTITTSMIEDGLAHQEFFPVYQPLVHPDDGSVHRVEVLARWSHEGQLIAPERFFACAGSSPLAAAIDQQVHQTAFLTVPPSSDVATLALSVNLSAALLQDAQALERWVTQVVPPTWDPQHITVELLETIPVTPAIHAALERLAAARFRLAIDDFGQGQSGLSLLSTHRFAELKLDRTVMAQIHTPRGQTLAAWVVDLAQTLQMMTVAEGIETPRQWQRCRELGIDWLQGFLFGPGMSWPEMRQYRAIPPHGPRQAAEGLSKEATDHADS